LRRILRGITTGLLWWSSGTTMARLLWLLKDKIGYRELYETVKGQAGFLTTSVSRPQILARLSAALADSPGLFNSRKLLAECRSFVRLGNGGVGAKSGAHDDRVMAMAIGLAARAELLGQGSEKRPETRDWEEQKQAAPLRCG
jgi:hypothetical protein